jgi:hypothetical protein
MSEKGLCRHGQRAQPSAAHPAATTAVATATAATAAAEASTLHIIADLPTSRRTEEAKTVWGKHLRHRRC